MNAPADPDRWARITDLFDRALSVRVEDREAWLVAICGGDESLHDEVASLLRVHERAGTFLSRPAVEAPHHLDTGALPLPDGPVGPYHVQRVLGQGGMGVVYLAEDPRLGRLVALKAVAPAYAGDGDRIERLRREARAAASLAHPNIATVFALEEAGGRLYMVSEYVEGETLRAELARGAQPVAAAIETIVTLSRAVAAAHARGIVHRDLKPENIVRTADGVLKILDFGLAITAESASASLTADGAALGTPAYMSPEQIRARAVDARSDQFALGILLYELVTGRHPFLARTPAATLARVLEAAPAPLRLALPDEVRHTTTDEFIDRLETVVMRCLQKRPDDRYADTAALTAALERFHTSMSVDTPTVHPRALWWWQFHQAAVATLYTLLLIPLWRLRHLITSGLGVSLFLLALTAVVLAGTLRLHLWFAMRQYPEQWLDQHSRARRWIRVADVTFAAILLAQGVIAAQTDTPAAPLLVAAAVAVTVTFLMVEPATTRAAFGPSR